MASNLDSSRRAVPDFENWESPETRIRWERGLAIVAAMIGVVLTFFFIMSVLPLSSDSNEAPVTGRATVPPAATAAATPAAQATQAPAAPQAPSVPIQGLNATSRAVPNVRRGPGLDAAVVRQLSQGQRVNVVARSTDNQWLQIVNPDNPNERLWVSADMLDVSGDPRSLPEAR